MNNHADNKSILVAVYMITYNHRDFIEQAIKSVINQKTNFNFKIFIGDDCSSDGTSEICKKISQEYQDVISYERNEKNIGAIQNASYTFQRCFKSGAKYIALLEGDDYWTDSFKLQKQVDYLEIHDSVVISAHNTIKMLSDGKPYLYNRNKKYSNTDNDHIHTIEDYIIKDFFHTSSIVFRRTALKEFPPWYANVFGGDYFLVLLISMNGKIHFFNETLSVYRINQKSISNYSTRMEILNNYLIHYRLFDEYSGYKYHKYLKKKEFSILFGRYYYYPSYSKKLSFAFANLVKIIRLHPSVISRLGRWKIFIPTFLLRSKVNLFSKIRD